MTAPVNAYGRQLSEHEIASGLHRELVGGLWEELGRLQVEFVKARGLMPEHTLIDVGCGALRGGLHFIRYLNNGNYCGIDGNRSLIEAAQLELEAAGLSARAPRLLVNDAFELSRFGCTFDYAIAVSLFTHLPMTGIGRCLAEVYRVLKPGVGRFYASFFQAPHVRHLDPIRHSPGEITTYVDADPFHYSFDEMQALADPVGMHVDLIGDWHHPRNQKMLCFTRRNDGQLRL